MHLACARTSPQRAQLTAEGAPARYAPSGLRGGALWPLQGLLGREGGIVGRSLSCWQAPWAPGDLAELEGCPGAGRGRGKGEMRESALSSAEVGVRGRGGRVCPGSRWPQGSSHRAVEGLWAFISRKSKLPTQPRPPPQVYQNRKMAICPRKSKSCSFQLPWGEGTGNGKVKKRSYYSTG